MKTETPTNTSATTKIKPGKEDLLHKILNNKKRPLAHYLYPTEPVYSSIIAEDEAPVSHVNKTFMAYDDVSDVINCVDITINKALNHPAVWSKRKEREPRNIIKVRVEGIKDPLYFCTLDSKRIICTEVTRKSSKIVIPG
jgi:hypothetical protein